MRRRHARRSSWSRAARPALSPSPGVAAARRRPPTITLVTHDSFAVSKPVLAAFTKQTGIEVKVLQVGRRRAGAEPGDPHQGRTRSATCSSASTTRSSPARSTPRIFEPYEPPALDAGARRSSSSTPTHRLTPIDYGDVCVNYDKAVVRQAEASRCRRRSTTSPSPRTRACSWSRTRRRRRPASRSCSRPIARVRRRRLARLLGAAARQRREGRRRLGEAYNGEFSQGANQGDVPAGRVVRVEPAGRGATTRSPSRRRRPSGPCSTRASARSSSPASSRAPSTRPRHASSSTSCCRSGSRPTCRSRCSCSRSRDGTPLPPVFTKFAEVAARPALAAARATSARNRDEWIEQWTDTVLR